MEQSRSDEEIRQLISGKLHMSFSHHSIGSVDIERARELLKQEGDFNIAYDVSGESRSAEDFQSDPYYGAPYPNSSFEIVSTRG